MWSFLGIGRDERRLGRLLPSCSEPQRSWLHFNCQPLISHPKINLLISKHIPFYLKEEPDIPYLTAMEGLGVAANVIAVIDLTVKVASLCLQYAKDVKNAADDIHRLHEEVTNLERVTKQVEGLLKGPNGMKLQNSQILDDALKRSRSHLEELDQKLKTNPGRKAMRRIGLRAFKWPFQREEAERLILELRQRSQTMSWTLQVDQT